jgi:hypothetical protein
MPIAAPELPPVLAEPDELLPAVVVVGKGDCAVSLFAMMVFSVG